MIILFIALYEDFEMIRRFTLIFFYSFPLTSKGWRKLKFHKQKPVELDNDFMGGRQVQSSQHSLRS